MKFSVIVPAHNSEKTLENCINSILANKINDEYEIIIVENGSTDNTVCIAKTIARRAKNVKVLIADRKNNVGYARNCGIKASKGQYIIFVDSDDMVKNSLLADLDTVIEKEHPDFVRYTGERIVNNSIKRIDGYRGNNNSVNYDEIVANIFDKKTIMTYVWLLAVRREKIKLFNEDINYLEDMLFYLDNLNGARIYCSDIDGYTYIQNDGSITNDYRQALYVIDDIKEVKRMLSVRKINKNLIDGWYVNLLMSKVELYCRNMSQPDMRTIINSIRNVLKEEHPAISAKSVSLFHRILYAFVKLGMYKSISLLCAIKAKIR